MLAAVTVLLSTVIVSYETAAAQSEAAVAPETSSNARHSERSAPIVVELEHEFDAAHAEQHSETEHSETEDSATEHSETEHSADDVAQITAVQQEVRELRHANREQRAQLLEESATIRGATGFLSGPRAQQTTNGLFVTYTNSVPSSAKAAIENAVAKWIAAVDMTAAPVEIEVTWSSLGGGVLGSAGPETYISHSSLPSAHWYPASQANVLGGVDFNGSARPEIQVELNSNVNWYTGTSGQPASNQIDLVSVVLHEIGHGLGFLGSARVSSGILGLISPPFIYDRGVTYQGSLLTNHADQQSALTSNNLYIKSSATTTAELYAPSTWLQGTSYSHFRSVGSQSNSLMTPSLQYGLAKRSIDDLTLGVLEQTGWELLANNSGGGSGSSGQGTTNEECSISSPNTTFASAVADDAVGAQVWRLYSAYYLRQPASNGYDYWRSARDSGWAHTKISNFFASSTEFDNRYGTLTNGQFVDLVFDNVLCRQPNATGRSYWIGRLSAGMTRGDLMLFFSEGEEYLNKTGTAFPLVN